MCHQHLRSVWFPALSSVVIASAMMAPQSLVATVEDCEFRNQAERRKFSSASSLRLRVRVSGKGNYYIYKMGPATFTDPARPEGYSPPLPISSPLIQNMTRLPEGQLVLCLRGVEVGRTGHVVRIQPASHATVYRWKKNTTDRRRE